MSYSSVINGSKFFVMSQLLIIINLENKFIRKDYYWDHLHIHPNLKLHGTSNHYIQFKSILSIALQI
jgi:hypothetical protein